MIDSFFSESVKEYIHTEISAASDNEVFFVGSSNEKGVVSDVEVVARGNKYSVPAIVDSAELGQVVIHNHPSGNLTPSDQDIYMASLFGNNGVGFYIVDNYLDNVYVVVEPFKRKEYQNLELEELKETLSPNGEIAKILDRSYEFRKEQIDAMTEFALSFNHDSISLVEAGTGTGKTLSYLIPAVR